MTSLTETVSSHPPTPLPLLMLAAKHGPVEAAPNALKAGSSTTTEFVFQSALTAELMTQVEPAPGASEAMTFPTEPVSSHPQTPRDLPWLAARSGTGQLKHAQNALLSGTSTPTEFVLRSQPSVLLTIPTEPVQAATVDSPSTTESARSLLVSPFPIKDARPLPTEPALSAQPTSSSTPTTSAEPSQTNA